MLCTTITLTALPAIPRCALPRVGLPGDNGMTSVTTRHARRVMWTRHHTMGLLPPTSGGLGPPHLIANIREGRLYTHLETITTIRIAPTITKTWTSRTTYMNRSYSHTKNIKNKNKNIKELVLYNTSCNIYTSHHTTHMHTHPQCMLCHMHVCMS